MALKRQVLPEEISYAVAWLASRESDAVTGQNISPNCGQAIVGIWALLRRLAAVQLALGSEFLPRLAVQPFGIRLIRASL